MTLPELASEVIFQIAIQPTIIHTMHCQIKWPLLGCTRPPRGVVHPVPEPLGVLKPEINNKTKCKQIITGHGVQEGNLMIILLEIIIKEDNR